MLINAIFAIFSEMGLSARQALGIIYQHFEYLFLFVVGYIWSVSIITKVIQCQVAVDPWSATPIVPEVVFTSAN